jgi:hypothetical protein
MFVNSYDLHCGAAGVMWIDFRLHDWSILDMSSTHFLSFKEAALMRSAHSLKGTPTSFEARIDSTLVELGHDCLYHRWYVVRLAKIIENVSLGA